MATDHGVIAQECTNKGRTLFIDLDMAHYINAEQLKAELDKRYTEYRAKMKTDDFTYYEGMADALDLFEQYIDSLPEQPKEGLEEEIKRMVYDVVYDLDGPAIMGTSEYLSVEDIAAIARHFYELGRKDKEDK